MSRASPRIEGLARRVIAIEAERAGLSDRRKCPAALAYERMRAPLTNVMGVTGFTSLASRALALARQGDPALSVLTMRSDGSLEGFEDHGRDRESGTADRAAEFVVARLVGLLSTFLGESLTVRLLLDIWPDASASETDSIGGDIS
jgi:hypothetical protein